MSTLTFGQESKKGPVIICPAGKEPNPQYIAPPKVFSPSNSRTQGSIGDEIFEVEYIGFSNAAQEAFQQAVDIWESIIKTDVKIRVQAVWEPLPSGALGAAGASTLYRNFDNAPKRNVWYAVALAEKLAGRNLNDTTEFDIVASFNSDFDNWYLGTDGTPGSKYDLVTVVLHELGHGLGFFSGDSYDEGVGQWDFSGGFPVIYTSLLENLDGSLNILDIENSSTEAGDFLTSNNVYINSYLVNINNGSPAKVFAPATYDEGSSISHWDETTYNFTGDALMTPVLSPSEALHNPGLLTLSLFSDMGWFRTSLSHENILLAEKTKPYTIEISIDSDTAIIDDEFKVKYFYPEGDTIDINLTEVLPGEYSATLNPNVNEEIINYYFEGLKDALNKSYRLPEEGVFRTELKALELESTPFLSSDGGDFNSNGLFDPVSTNQDFKLWEWGIAENKFNGLSSNAWVTRLDEPIGRPEVVTENALITPLFDLSDSSLDYILSFDYLAEFSGHDYVGVYFSLDSGKTWQKLGAANGIGNNWYNEDVMGDYFSEDTKDSEGSFLVKSASYPLYEVQSNYAMFKISHFINPDGDRNSYETSGFMVDNFEITTSTPKARFVSLDTGLVFPGDEVRFIYTSSGATQFTWDFGDGNLSSEMNPTHVYEEGGSYSVSLIVDFAGGQDDALRSDYIKVIENKGSTYLKQDGGDFESNSSDFIAVNQTGTGFQRGLSSIQGKSETSSGDFAWVTGIEELEYQNNSEAYLYTPEFDFTILGQYELSFMAKYSFENLWDGFIVEYTVDRGKTWEKLNDQVEEGWYDAISDPDAVFGSSVPIFTGSTNNEFIKKNADVSFLGGEEHVSFRFKFQTDPAVVDAGLALDDFELIGPVPGAVVPQFSASLESGITGCANSSFIFKNESTGSVTQLNWFFGENATPSVASGSGPHLVNFPEAGSYTIVMTAVDDNSSTFTTDTTLQISDEHNPTITVVSEGPSTVLSASEGDAYQWFLAASPIEGETHREFTATQSGTYSVEVTKGFCKNRANELFVVASIVDELKVRMFPNPSDGLINIQSDYLFSKIEIFSLTGEIIYQNEFSSTDNLKLDLMPFRFNTGLYLIKLHSDLGRKTIKRIIIR